MPSAADILNDPNYINANAATKRAIFERRVATLPEYRNANAGTQAAIRQRFKVEGGAQTQPKTPARQRGTGIGPVDFMLDAINETALGAVEGAYNTGAFFTDPLLRLFAGGDTLQKVQAQRKNMFDAASRQVSTRELPLNRFAGSVVVPAGVVSKGAKVIAPVVQKIPKVGPTLARVTQSAGSGGIGTGRTAAQTAKIPIKERAIDLAERVVGGAVGGVAGGQLMGSENAVQDAIIGGVLPVGVGAAGGIVGKIVDVFRSDKVQAAKLFREALGTDLEAARQVFANLSPDDQRLARRVLIDEGVEPDAFMAMGANMEGLRPQQTRLINEAEDAAALRGLEQAAGGATQEEIRAATRAGRADVTNQMAPVREAMYDSAGRASREVPVALRTAQELEAEAAAQSGLARRMVMGSERAETRLGQMDDLGDAFDPTAVQRERGIAGAMGERGERAAANAIDARAQAADLYDMVDDMAAQGMRPMRAADLIGALRGKLADPEILRGSLEERTIKNVVGQLEKATDANGMLNPRALGKIRRSGINEIVNRLSTQMGATQSRTGTPQAAQATILDLRGLIDDTLRKGGAGDLVDEFLQKSEQGYAAVNRGELAGEALRMYKEAPADFLKLVGGDRPKVVGKIMGGGPENEVFGNALTAQTSIPFTQAAGLMTGRNRMEELARSGATKAIDIMNIETPSKMRAATKIAMSTVPAGRIAAEGAETLAGNFMRPKISARLAEGFMPGQSANTLLNTYSTPLMVDDVLSRLPPNIRNMLVQSARQSFTSDQR